MRSSKIPSWGRNMLFTSALIILGALFTVGAVTTPAAVPSLVNYQGVLKNPGGTPQVGMFTVTFTIYPVPAGGSIIWTEVQSVTTNGDGLFNVLLGSVTPITDAVFSGPDRYLSTAVSPDPEMTPRTRIATVAYAFRPATVDGATGGTIVTKVSIGVGHVNTGTDAFIAGASNTASGNFSAVGGGLNDTANGTYSAVGGGLLNAANGASSTVSGGTKNSATSDASTIAGGQQNVIDVGATLAAVGGGYKNLVSGYAGTASGGWEDTVSRDYGAVGGGRNNTAGGQGANVSGGGFNKARGLYATVSGGGGDAAVDSNSAQGDYSYVGGGGFNVSRGEYAAAAGGRGNTADTQYTSVGGGWSNHASGWASTVAGGSGCVAGGQTSVVGGGDGNQATPYASTVCGGIGNHISAGADGSTIGGGGVHGIRTNARYSTIPGGADIIIRASYAFAAGRNAEVLAAHAGSFIWADSLNSIFQSTNANEFAARATGGVRFVTGVSPVVGVQVAAGGGSWSSISDRTVKANVEPVNGEDLLFRLSQIPVATWNYKSQDPSIRHIGPMAQDFYAAFRVGEDDKHITTIDADGIALAAIQALYKQQKTENQELRSQIAELRAMVAALQGGQEKAAGR
ncbi:MAG: tail fiber domain-containing protein [candidate division Zixibacteria bacterium]|nr:tail fiber domain-containing protein [candidate division Zixibacteria bacterium]